MHHAHSLALIAAVYLAVLASPGPNFIILSDLALGGRRREARWVVCGLTAGSIFWVVLALAGVAAVLDRHPWLSTAVRVAGSAYLVGYGIKLLYGSWRPSVRAAPVPTGTDDSRRRRDAFRSGLLTSITNPKGAAFWTSAAATLMPPSPSFGFGVATIVLVGLLSLAWHLGIASVFGTRRLRERYLRIKRHVDRVAGSALVLLGLQRI